MDSICRFIPAKSSGDLKTVHFVYETELRKLKQPFIYPIYYIHLVTRGTGTLTVLSRTYDLAVGTLFFAFPGVPYTLEGSDDLSYMYISFMGLRAQEWMTEWKLDATHPTIDGFAQEIPFWKSAIQRLQPKNANILTESVLLYTLSLLEIADEQTVKVKTNNVLENILSYIDHHYTDPDISLKRIADIFAYTDKYLSHVFKENMQINFSEYLTRLRIQRALELIAGGERDVAAISAACGFRDPVYFAKVFKKLMGSTPLAYGKTQSDPSKQ